MKTKKYHGEIIYKEKNDVWRYDCGGAVRSCEYCGDGRLYCPACDFDFTVKEFYTLMWYHSTISRIKEICEKLEENKRLMDLVKYIANCKEHGKGLPLEHYKKLLQERKELYKRLQENLNKKAKYKHYLKNTLKEGENINILECNYRQELCDCINFKL